MLEHEVDVAAEIAGDLAEAESRHTIGVADRHGDLVSGYAENTFVRAIRGAGVIERFRRRGGER